MIYKYIHNNTTTEFTNPEAFEEPSKKFPREKEENTGQKNLKSRDASTKRELFFIDRSGFTTKTGRIILTLYC
ncbi:hypothetical protein [Methanococcoides sp. NM1]|uniref:hypothetical protein n=1 Tax=Methanococcoides sp. NM1 TaxID=1201013 RepID=UPI0010832D09|nr:hypothetical protein [Methanococcoides sp. NM1]